MLVPPPAPSYTFAPDVGPLTLGQQATLDACLAALTRRVAGVVVTPATTTATHHVVELVTPAGTLSAGARGAAPDPRPRALAPGARAGLVCRPARRWERADNRMHRFQEG